MLLKKGDLIICDGSGRSDGVSSWWVMRRDETLDDRNHNRINADLVSRPYLSGFECNPCTSWDTTILDSEGAVVVPADEWTDEHYVQIALWALCEGSSQNELDS